MTTRFHINSRGDAGPCQASQGGCPFGDDSDHYETADEARAAFEQEMGGGFDADHWDSPEGKLERLKDGLGADEDGEARFEELKELIQNDEVVLAQDRMIQHFKNRGRSLDAYQGLWPVLKEQAVLDSRAGLRADLVKTLERDPRGTGSTFFSAVRSADDYLPEDIDAIAEAQLKPLKRVAAETRTMNKTCAKYGVTQADFEGWAAAHPALPKMVVGDREIVFHPSRHLWVHGLVENGGRTPDKSAGYTDKTGAEVAEWVAKGRPMPTSEQSEARAEKGREHFRGWGRSKQSHEEALRQATAIDRAARAIAQAQADAAYYDNLAATNPQRRKAAKELANESRQKAERVAKELDPAMIEALKLKYLKKFKVHPDDVGVSVPELLQMAQRGELG